MNELTETKLSRPLDRANLSNDNATLRNLLGVLNNPAITGAIVPDEEKANMKSFPSAQTATLPEPAPAAPAATTTAPVAPPTPPGARLFFTGRGVGEVVKAIGATEVAVNAPIIALARYFFPGLDGKTPGAEALLSTLKAYGNGEFSSAYPVSPARATFIIMVRTLGKQGLLPEIASDHWAKFGAEEGFWISAATLKADQIEGRVVITGISSEMEYLYLTHNNYQHWHVTARPGHKVGTNPGSEKLNTSMDNDVTKKVSAQREGKKLRVIWNDTANSISNRLWSVADFVIACGGLTPELESPETAISFE